MVSLVISHLYKFLYQVVYLCIQTAYILSLIGLKWNRPLPAIWCCPNVPEWWTGTGALIGQSCPWRQETVLTTLAFLWCVHRPGCRTQPEWAGRAAGMKSFLDVYSWAAYPPASLTAGTLTSCMELTLGEEPAPAVTGLLGRPGFSKSMGLVIRFVPSQDLGEEARWMWPTAGVAFKNVVQEPRTNS